MASKSRYVFDTSVIVSALLFEQSTPGRAFYEALERGEILLSQALVEELNDVLSREKFQRYVHRAERERFLIALVRAATLVEVTERIDACRDPNDNKILELAIAGRASQIVTGDEDLLALDPFRGIPIVNPAQFCESLQRDV